MQRKPRANRAADLVTVASTHLNTMGVSLEWFGEIAAELGVTRPALYNYVNDRSDLLFRCYTRALEVLGAALDRALRESDDAAEALAAFLTFTNDRDATETAVLCELEALPPDKEAMIHAARDALVARCASIVERGAASGLFRKANAVVIANAVIGLATWSPLSRRWRAPGDSPLHAAVGAREILLRGLAADPHAPYETPVCFVRRAQEKIDLFDRRALDEARRETVLLVASALFNRRGVGATRVEDVADAVGLSKRAIYRYIGRKDALIEACVDRAYRFYFSVMDSAEVLETTRLEAVAGAVHDVIEAASDPEMSVLVPYVGFGQMSATGRGRANAYAQRLFDGYRKIIVDGMREGSIRALPLPEILSAMPGLFNWASNWLPTSGEDRKSVADELARIMTRGILA